MHYLITGGAGFIGSNLISTILSTDTGASITCIDNFDPFYSPAVKRHNIAAWSGDNRFRLIEQDLAFSTVADLVSLVPEPIDIIVHLAAKAGVRPSILDPIAYEHANIIGTQHLLDFARVKKIEQFVFASTSSVYGVNEHFPWKETDRLLPISPYAMTKMSGEMMGHVYHRLYGIRFLALRFFTVYGPGQRPDLAIHKFTRSILAGRPIPVYGAGNTSRDYTFVADTVRGIIAATRYRQTGFEIINLGNNETVTLSELIAAIEETIGRKAIIDRQPEQPGDVPKTYADITKAEELLGYRPQVKLKQGLAQFYTWFQENKALLAE